MQSNVSHIKPAHYPNSSYMVTWHQKTLSFLCSVEALGVAGKAEKLYASLEVLQGMPEATTPDPEGFKVKQG